MTVRVRIEPSPSGSIHVGNAYAGLFNWLWARKHKGVFILRIADTDKERVTAEGIRSALEDFRWLGLEWDEGPEVGGPHEPYFQSERTDLYKAAADKLRASGHAYPCYCTAEELEERRVKAMAEKRTPGYDGRCKDLTAAQRRAFEKEGRESALRFRMPEGEIKVNDLIRGEVHWDHKYIPDFVIQRADGTPLYMLAVTYDDMVMQMTHVIRADEHLSNTPKQIAIMRALGATPPEYAHMPLIVGNDRKKLSKRYSATSIAEYRAMGFLPDALLNYLALLSWSSGDGVTERFTIPELVEKFDLKDMTRNPSAFDLAKLTAMNGDRIRDLPVDEFIELIEPFLAKSDVLPPSPTAAQRALIREMAPHIQERIKRLDEAPEQLRFLFHDVEPDEKAVKQLTAKQAPILEAARGVIENVEPWEVHALETALQGWADGAGIKRKDAFQPLRAAVTGSLISPPLFESIHALGRDRTLQRLSQALLRARG